MLDSASLILLRRNKDKMDICGTMVVYAEPCDGLRILQIPKAEASRIMLRTMPMLNGTAQNKMHDAWMTKRISPQMNEARGRQKTIARGIMLLS